MYRDKEIKIRLTANELARLDRSVKRTTMSREGYIRTLLRGYEPQTKPPERFWELLHELWEISNILSRYADTLPNTELPELYKRLGKVCGQLQALPVPQKSEI